MRRRLKQCTTTLSIFFVLLGLALSASPAAFAGGGQHYPDGAEDFMVGALPPPGKYLVNYLGYIGKDELKDNNGDDTGLDFDADVFVEVPRFIWVSDTKILGANYAAHIFIPFYRADLDISAGGTTLVDSDDMGLGDIIVSPFILGWHFGPNFHMVATVDTYIPTGNYDKDEPASQILSRNHWTFEPVLALTYLAGGFDFSVKFMYDINTDNDEYMDGGNEVTLSPGNEFHFDWAVGYMAGDFEFGLNGFQYWQVTDDEIDGKKVEDSRSQYAGIGPALKWWPDKGRFSLVLKHMQEYGAKNMPEGHRTFLKAIWAF